MLDESLQCPIRILTVSYDPVSRRLADAVTEKYSVPLCLTLIPAKGRVDPVCRVDAIAETVRDKEVGVLLREDVGTWIQDSCRSSCL